MRIRLANPRRRRAFRTLALVATTLAVACKSDGVSPEPGGLATLALEPVVTGLTEPLFVTAAPDDPARLFVVERGGLVRILENGTLLPTPFLDVSALVSAGGEQGLLGLAFHPDHAANGRFFVNYTDTDGDTRVEGYTVSADPSVADDASAETVLSVEQPFTNHNGGMLAFGPDGMLYVGLGDGGSAGDPQNNAQSPATLLGSLLRLDVDGGSPYAIPLDNPFASHATYRPETWAYGLRNPWRYSFDRTTGDLYIADVGQSVVEEVSFQPASSAGGENYGWPILEGTRCFRPPSGCSSAGTTLPIHEYGHGDGCSISGGYVYRGTDYPTLQGRYFYGDFCSGWIRSFRVQTGEAVDLRDHSTEVAAVPQLASFGEDAGGELYVVSLAGTIWRVTEAGAGP